MIKLNYLKSQCDIIFMLPASRSMINILPLAYPIPNWHNLNKISDIIANGTLCISIANGSTLGLETM